MNRKQDWCGSRIHFRKNTIIRSIGQTLEMPELPYAVQKRNLVNFIILTNEISFDKILYGKNIGFIKKLMSLQNELVIISSYVGEMSLWGEYKQ